GFKAIALTVDTPRLGRREADIKNRYNSSTVIYYFFNCIRHSRVAILDIAKNRN
ncbi:peroxisomal (S)-2-hydroxy-acid oxidase GLO1-like, partial [Trifolium medium]|nr:peroxisomal (S)-2-hydroxy-acid oxidase GLO1-like [Trifolium medium]